MRFPKNQSLVSDRNVARCRGEGRSGFTKRNNFRIKMIYGCIEDISITENFLMHQRIGVERTLHPACVRAKDLVGYLARPGALCLLGMFQSHCAMRNQMKKVLKHSVSLFLEGISPYQLNSAMHLERFYKETICR